MPSKFTRNNQIYTEREAGAKFSELSKKYNIHVSSVMDVYNNVKNKIAKHGTLYGLPSQLVTALRKAGITSKFEAIEKINNGELYPNSIYMYGQGYHNLLCDFLDIKEHKKLFTNLRVENAVKYLESKGYEIKFKGEVK